MRNVRTFVVLAVAAALGGCVVPSIRNENGQRGIVFDPVATEGEVDAVKDALTAEGKALREEIAAVEKRAIENATNGDKALLETFTTAQTAAGEAFRKALDAGNSPQNAELERLRVLAEGAGRAAAEADARSAAAIAASAANATKIDDEAGVRKKALDDAVAEVRAGKITLDKAVEKIGDKTGLPIGDILLLLGGATGLYGGGKVVAAARKKKPDGAPSGGKPPGLSAG